VEGGEAKEGMRRSLTRNYLTVLLPAADGREGERLQVRIADRDDRGLLGERA